MFFLTKPSWKIEAYTGQEDGEMAGILERAARTCYRSKHVGGDYLISGLIKRGHESVIEHAAITVRIVCDRGISHELVRHRLASFSQASTRYIDSTDGPEYIVPRWLDLKVGQYALGKDGWYCNNQICTVDEAVDRWLLALFQASTSYRALRACGWSPQKARSVLPNALKTELVMTANPREWRHVFKLRCSPRAHPQMREIMIPMLEEFADRWLYLFGDIETKGKNNEHNS